MSLCEPTQFSIPAIMITKCLCLFVSHMLTCIVVPALIGTGLRCDMSCRILTGMVGMQHNAYMAIPAGCTASKLHLEWANA